MHNPDEPCHDVGLQFFGRISASVSHDIKNYFSIINENAGLLADFALMAEKGNPLDPGRIKGIADSIQNQIRQADAVVRNMNVFSHSVDKPSATVDLVEDLRIVSVLNRRLYAMQRVETRVDASESAIIITGPRFDLMHLFSHCIQAAVSAISIERQLVIYIEKEEVAARIRFSGIADFERFNGNFMDDTGKRLLAKTGAQISDDVKGEAMEIQIPVSYR